MKKKLLIVAMTIVLLFISACTVQNKKECYVNEKNNRQPVPPTHFYNSQVPVKSQDLNINRQNSTVPTPIGVYPDKYRMFYQNSNSGTDSTEPR